MLIASVRSKLSRTGARVRLILTGIDSPSRNAKTGPMIQLFFLRSGVRPDVAQRLGADDAICGNCPLRWALAKLTKAVSCYVTVVQSVLSTWKAHIGARVRFPRVLRRPVRLGAYGDPASAPVGILRSLVALSGRWTGYTHQWKRAPELRTLCMASVDTPAQAADAWSRGWRTFRVRQVDDSGRPEPLLAGESVCPASHEYRATHPHKAPVQCYTCLLCDGARTGREHVANIAIIAHGSGVNADLTTTA